MLIISSASSSESHEKLSVTVTVVVHSSVNRPASSEHAIIFLCQESTANDVVQHNTGWTRWTYKSITEVDANAKSCDKLFTSAMSDDENVHRRFELP